MFTNVQKDNGLFTAIDESGRKVTVEESISFLFLVDADNKRVNYRAVDFRRPDVLSNIHDYMVGKNNEDMVHNIVVRYGWMDKHLNSLEFLPIADLVKRHVDKTLTGTDKGKMIAVLRQLSLSRKKVTVL